MNYASKYILLTGGTKGIGRSLFNELKARGARNIAVVARTKTDLDKLVKENEGLNILPIVTDMSKPESIAEGIEVLIEKWGKLDILINNAGVVSAGDLEDISDHDIINQVNINLTGVILLTKKCLPLLRKSDEAAIVNVSSGLGFIAWPFYNVYAATKAGVRQFSDAIRRDLFQFPIHVMTIYPTATDTPMMTNANMPYQMDDPNMVARISLDGLENGEINVIFGGEQRLRDIETNFKHPKEIDRKAEERYDELKKRTSEHRAM